MKIVTNPHAEQELAQLAERFNHWRQHRTTPAEPIPQALWDHAVALTAVLPRSRVARRLRLSGQALKQHCASQHTAPSANTPPAAMDFVELTYLRLGRSPPSARRSICNAPMVHVCAFTAMSRSHRLRPWCGPF